jgi:hypothetical protein
MPLLLYPPGEKVYQYPLDRRLVIPRTNLDALEKRNCLAPVRNQALATQLIAIPPDKGMVRSDMSKPADFFFSLQEYTQQNSLSKF